MKLFPQKNIGTADRIIRIVIGVAILLYIIMGNHTLLTTVVLGVLAVFCFYQALTSWCLWYQIIGKNTCPVVIDDK